MNVAVITLLTGISAGYLAQRSRMCFIAGLRDLILVRDTELLMTVLGFVAMAFFAFPIAGAIGLPVWGLNDPTVSAGTGTAPVAFTAGILVGGLATAGGGCPLRQHVMAAQGSGDAWYWVLGFYLGAPLHYLVIWPLLAPWIQG